MNLRRACELTAFSRACEAFKTKIGLLMFKFSRFHPSAFAHGRDFMVVLDHFLGRIPKGWRYGVEIRNRHFLHPDCFAMLTRHGVAHIFKTGPTCPRWASRWRCRGARRIRACAERGSCSRRGASIGTRLTCSARNTG